MTDAILGYGVKLYYGDGGTGSGTKASYSLTGNIMTIQAKVAGVAGNSKKVNVVVNGNNTPFSFVATKNLLTINSATDSSGNATTTVASAIANLYLDSTFTEYWQATLGSGDGSAVLVTTSGEKSLTGGSDGTETFTQIAEVTSLPLPKEEGTEVEATHLNSPNKMREYIAGLADGGELAFECNFIPTDESQSAMRALRRSGVSTNFKVEFLDGTTCTFTAFVKSWDAGTATADAVITATITLKLTGDATWA